MSVFEKLTYKSQSQCNLKTLITYTLRRSFGLGLMPVLAVINRGVYAT